MMSINPKHTALVFPGQGSQCLGMGRALAETDPVAAQVFAQADDLLGYPLRRLCWDGPVASLAQTEHTQPAMLTHSIAVWRTLQARHPSLVPACTAGHSLGQFSALVAAGALAFPDALRLVAERGQAMKEAGERCPGGMLAVLGLEARAVESVCQGVSVETGLTVVVANDNCPRQLVISGDMKVLQVAEQRLLEAGARKTIPLAVSIASHSPLMEPAQERFQQALRDTPMRAPRVPVYGNVRAQAMTKVSQVRADLAAQLTSTVRWTQSVRQMIKAGIDTFLELGSGDVLSGLIRRTDASVRCLSIGDPDGFDRLSAF